MTKKAISKRIFISCLIFLAAHNYINAQAGRDTSRRSGGGSFFTGGTASATRFATPPEMKCGVARVSFEPRARTIWHSHAGGQVIVVTSGTAWYQEKGKPKQIIRSGEAVIAAPGVMHWHGASPDGPMSHTVATPNLDMGGVTEGNAVRDEDYHSPPAK